MMKALPPSLISTQSGVSSAESDAPAGSPELQPPEKNTLRRRLIGNATMATGSALGTNAWRRTASMRPLDAPLTTPVADATGPPWTPASGSRYAVGTRRRSGEPSRREPRSGGGR